MRQSSCISWFNATTCLVGYEYDAQENDSGARRDVHIEINLVASSL